MPEKMLSHARRRSTGVPATTALGTILTLLVAAPLVAAQPAAAAPAVPTCTSSAFTHSAAADLLRIARLDLRPLGLRLGPVADVSLAVTRSGMSASPAQTTAAARYLDGNLAGLGQVPTGTAYQQAPPPPPTEESRVHVQGADLGMLRVGGGDLRAHAGWQDGYPCGTAVGQTTSSSATIADAAVLPGANGRSLLRLPSNPDTSTATGLLMQDQRVASTAVAAAGVSGLRLFEGTEGQVTVQVSTEPKLIVVAGGTRASSSVRYTSPVLNVTLPDGQVRRLDSPGAYLDLALPPSAAGTASALAAARTEGLPLLAGNPLAALLGSLHLPATTAAPLAVVRLSIGSLEEQITDASVHAQATTLRLQLLLRPAGSQHCPITVMDLGIGVLEATAAARGGVPAPAPVPTPAAPSPIVRNGGLPVTGTSLTWMLATGALLVVSGGLLMALARRRVAG
jgi:hypothetical protein